MASTNKTQNIGLSLWELGDKPGMEDFNADNKRLDTVLEDIKERLIKQDLRTELAQLQQQLEQLKQSDQTASQPLPLTPGFTQVEESYVVKTNGTLVSVNISLKKADGSAFAAKEVVAVLPAEYHPKATIKVMGYGDSDPTHVRQPILFLINTKGEIQLLHMQGTEWLGCKRIEMHTTFIVD